jgi:hypothetical protein
VDEPRHVQLIRIFQVSPVTLDETQVLAVRAYVTDVEAEQLGHRLWREWLRQNPLIPSMMSFGRRNSNHDRVYADDLVS